MIAPLARGDRPAAAPQEGPRFALRFEDGRGLLSLARPLRFSFGTVEALELSLGALRFPLDLSAGASRFRTRRTRVRAARVRIDLDACIEDLAIEPYRFVPLAPRDGGLAMALADPYGTVAFDAHARIDGADLELALSSARSATEGPAPPTVRVLAAARALGLELDPERGTLRIERALSAVLMEALVPRGWRVPDDRGVRVALEVLGKTRLLLRTLEAGESDRAHDPEPWERARRLAPITLALARGDRAEAARAFAALRERIGTVPAALAREAGQPTDEAPGDDPLALSLALRAAVREGRVDDALALAPALAAVEPSDAVAVEALCSAADLAITTRPEEAASLLERAAARRPRDARVVLRLIEALAASGRTDALTGAIDAALSSREPGPERGELAREAAMVCELAAAHEEAARLWRVAADQLPHDARVLEGLAELEARAGHDDAAMRLWDRAFEARTEDGDEEEAARSLSRAARIAERSGRLDVAEERLARASRLAPADAEAWAALARVRRAAGAIGSAARAEDRLLETAAGSGSREVADALVTAAEAALAQGELERARVFTAAVARTSSDHAALSSLSVRIEALDRERAPKRATERPRARPAPLSERPRAPLAEGVLEKAKQAALARDTAGLRAALSAAERAGDLDSARAIVELALEAVGDGPARQALLAARDRLGPR